MKKLKNWVIKLQDANNNFNFEEVYYNNFKDEKLKKLIIKKYTNLNILKDEKYYNIDLDNLTFKELRYRLNYLRKILYDVGYSQSLENDNIEVHNILLAYNSYSNGYKQKKWEIKQEEIKKNNEKNKYYVSKELKDLRSKTQAFLYDFIKERHKKEIEELKKQHNQKLEKINNTLKQKEQELRDLTTTQSQHNQSLENVNNELARVKNLLKQKEQELRELKNQLKNKKQEQELKSLKDLKNDLDNVNFELNKININFNIFKGQILSSKEKLTKLKDFNNELSQINQSLNILTFEIKALKDLKVEKEQYLILLKEKHNKKINDFNLAIEEVKKEINNQPNQEQELQDLKEKHKELLNNKKINDEDVNLTLSKLKIALNSFKGSQSSKKARFNK